ncbi:MAG: hypothetical protein BWY95_02472 [Bacteroidetes bacterium ADurb.BinA104]|nr:MAG: hypothetical protein BWY95_02472 [Bacteroidetes bacterium ADurb.BinA104]
MTIQCLGSNAFTLTAYIGRRCIIIVHSMLKSEIYQTVYLFLIYDIAALFITFLGPAHTAIAQYADTGIVLQHLSAQLFI